MEKILNNADIAKRIHEAEIRDAYNAGFDEGYYMNDRRYNPLKVKFKNSKDYYEKVFVEPPPKI